MRSIRKSPNERGGRISRMQGEEERSRGNEAGQKGSSVLAFVM